MKQNKTIFIFLLLLLAFAFSVYGHTNESIEFLYNESLEIWRLDANANGTKGYIHGSIAGTLIEKNVFIGTAVVLAPNIKIAEGTIVGANSFVNKSLMEKGIYVGNPAKKIRDL